MESNRKTPRPADPGASLVIRVLIVDDEIGAINTLRGMLRQYCPEVIISGTAASVREAITAAVQLRPDLVFLDIEMPPVGSGFDFLKNCPETGFGVIFTTAYPQYAVQAINVIQPWAYLVKPYSVSELKTAVQTAYQKLRQQHWNELRAAGQRAIIVPDSRKGTQVLRAEDIAFCKADGSFTQLYVLKQQKLEKITSSRNLGEFEAELPELLFCRTHHSFLVNLRYVERFERTGRNGIIHLSCSPAPVDVSVAKMDLFVSRLEEFCQLKALDGA